MEHRTRAATIARLQALGVTEAEITDLIRQERAAHPAQPMADLPAPKVRYHVRNWRDYNRALIQRGSLTIWFEDQTVSTWLGNERGGRVGSPTTYAHTAIQCILTLKAVFRLPLRQTQGLAGSLLQMLRVDLPLPHYSTLSRRSATLPVPLPRQARSKHLHLVVDSTGLKLYGDGEWHVRQHGVTKRRTWRKIHVGVDERTGEIVAQVVTARHVGDHEVMGQLVRQVPGRIHQCSGDGGYDYEAVYRTFARRRTRLTIPPRRGAARSPWDWMTQRNAHIARIAEVGRKQWKQECGYHRRSLAETAMFRLKTIFGDRLWARKLKRQQTEVAIRCAALNRMTQLGMPDSYAVTAC
jgi:IS5 family transposase